MSQFLTMLKSFRYCMVYFRKMAEYANLCFIVMYLKISFTFRLENISNMNLILLNWLYTGYSRMSTSWQHYMYYYAINHFYLVDVITTSIFFIYYKNSKYIETLKNQRVLFSKAKRMHETFILSKFFECQLLEYS